MTFLNSFSFKSGVQRQLSLYVIMPMLLVSGLAIAIGLQVASSSTKNRLQSDLDLVGRAISLPVGQALQNNDIASVQANLDSVFNIGRIYGASVYDDNGQQLANAGITENDLSESAVANETVTTGTSQESYRNFSGRNVYSQFVPVFDYGGQTIGLIQINRRASDFEQSLQQLTWYAWSIWASFGLVTMAILYFGHFQGVGKHVTQLRHTMKAVALGDRTVRAELNGPTELQEIAKGLNGMLDSIAQAERSLDERREKELALQKALQEKEKMAAVGNVASGVAHELGAPLTVISARANRLLKNQTDDEQIRQIRAIKGQVDRLTGLIKQLMSFARSPIQTKQPVNLVTAINQAIRQISFENTNDIAISLTQPTDIVIALDEARISLALVNLLRNALQAAKSSVTIKVHDHADYVEVTIDDDGDGIADKTGALEPFNSSKPQGKGTGLGLAIVQQVMLENNAVLTLSDNDAQGCRATITLHKTGDSLDFGKR